jgi:RNA polymerase sigma factor (sigma-70 family)
MDVAAAHAWRSEADVFHAPTIETLATTYLDRVHRYAVMVSPRDADPEDLAQQAMVKALEHLDRFDSRRGSMDAWLWRIVVNVARDAGRASRRRHFLLERLAARTAEQTLGMSPEVLALNQVRDQELVEAVRGLPRRDRSVIALRYGAGLNSTEVAKLMGMTRMAVAKATRRALDKLRAQLVTQGHYE